MFQFWWGDDPEVKKVQQQYNKLTQAEKRATHLFLQKYQGDELARLTAAKTAGNQAEVDRIIDTVLARKE